VGVLKYPGEGTANALGQKHDPKGWDANLWGAVYTLIKDLYMLYLQDKRQMEPEKRVQTGWTLSLTTTLVTQSLRQLYALQRSEDLALKGCTLLPRDIVRDPCVRSYDFYQRNCVLLVSREHQEQEHSPYWQE
jgi:hypothetical protein